MAEILQVATTLVPLGLIGPKICSLMAAMLKEFPPEVRKAVLLKQVEIKQNNKNYKSSHSQALIEIVKEWVELKKSKQAS
jgi:hypothetical protein